MPPYRTLYWRGPVLVDFDGAHLEDAQLRRRRAHRATRGASGPVRYTVTLEPHGKTLALRARRARRACPPGATLLVATCSCATAARSTRAHALRDDLVPRLPLRRERQPGAAATARCASTRRATRAPWRSAGSGRARTPDPRAILQARAPATSTASSPTRSSRRCSTERDPYDDFLFNTQAGLLRALRRQLHAAHARRRHPRARRDRLPGRRGEPAQQRADRAPGRCARVDRDLGRGRGLGARRSHGGGLAAARGERRERGARARSA